MKTTGYNREQAIELLKQFDANRANNGPGSNMFTDYMTDRPRITMDTNSNAHIFAAKTIIRYKKNK